MLRDLHTEVGPGYDAHAYPATLFHPHAASDPNAGRIPAFVPTTLGSPPCPLGTSSPKSRLTHECNVIYIMAMPRPYTATKRDRPHMTSLELAPELKAGLDAVKERDGVPQSEQIRRAIRMWLDAKGIDVERLKRATSRPKGGRA